MLLPCGVSDQSVDAHEHQRHIFMLKTQAADLSSYQIPQISEVQREIQTTKRKRKKVKKSVGKENICTLGDHAKD